MKNTPKTAFITGAGSGMGQLAAKQLAELGCIVAAVDINQDGLKTTAGYSNNIHTYTADVTDISQIEAALASFTEEFGPIQRLINAAAIMPYGRIMEHPTENILKVMNINYGGLVNTIKAVLPHMLENKQGEVVIFSSFLGVSPVLYTGAYCASKFATSAFAEVLAHEHKDSGLSFACVCPPAVKTPLLNQAHETIWPKILDENPPITSEEVLAQIEKDLAAGNFWVFPGKGTKAGWRIRRFFPEFIWKHIHKVEGE